MLAISSHCGEFCRFNRNVVFRGIVCIEGYGGGGGKSLGAFQQEERWELTSTGNEY